MLKFVAQEWQIEQLGARWSLTENMGRMFTCLGADGWSDFRVMKPTFHKTFIRDLPSILL